MIYPIYSYRDNKATFGAPIIEENEYTATRHFAYEINKAGGLMLFSPADFDLYKVGTFDPEKGELLGQIPEFVVSGSSVVTNK